MSTLPRASTKPKGIQQLLAICNIKWPRNRLAFLVGRLWSIQHGVHYEELAAECQWPWLGASCVPFVVKGKRPWIPAFAGMTDSESAFIDVHLRFWFLCGGETVVSSRLSLLSWESAKSADEERLPRFARNDGIADDVRPTLLPSYVLPSIRSPRASASPAVGLASGGFGVESLYQYHCRSCR